MISGYVFAHSHHYAKAEGKRARQEEVAVLNAKTALPGKQADNEVHADDGSAKDTSWVRQ